MLYISRCSAHVTGPTRISYTIITYSWARSWALRHLFLWPLSNPFIVDMKKWMQTEPFDHSVRFSLAYLTRINRYTFCTCHFVILLPLALGHRLTTSAFMSARRSIARNW